MLSKEIERQILCAVIFHPARLKIWFACKMMMMMMTANSEEGNAYFLYHPGVFCCFCCSQRFSKEKVSSLQLKVLLAIECRRNEYKKHKSAP
jgi:hypothetical protein